MSTESSDSGEPPTAPEQRAVTPTPAPALSVWERLKEHKIAQWTLAYAAAGYALLHGTEMLSSALEWPHVIVRILALMLLLGVPVVATIAWYQGHRALKRVSGAELMIITVLLVLTGTALWHFARLSPEHAAAKGDTSAHKTGAALPPATEKVPERSIAVLPFLDLSEKKDQEYFADGMAEEILNLLVKIPELKVIGRTSSFQFKGRSEDLRKIGTSLNTAYVVEGSVRRAGDHVRVTAQLIDTRDGAHRWSETYDRDVSDVVKVQVEIAAALVRALQLEVAPSILVKARASPRSVEAYDLYLRGLHASNRYDQQGFEEAVAHFRHALELDPSFIPAAEGLAWNLGNEVVWGFVPARVGWEQTRAVAKAALKLDPKSARAHAILGDVYREYDWNWLGAEQELKTAVGLAPTDPFVLFLAGVERMAVGQWSETSHLFAAAVTADPLDAILLSNLSHLYARLDRLTEAENTARRVLEISPTYSWGHYFLGLVLLLEGKTAEALVEMQKETAPDGQTLGLALVYHSLRRTQEANAAFADLKARHARHLAMSIAEVYAFRGQKDQAFEWLDRGYAERQSSLAYIKQEVLLDSLRTDPRYKAFLSKMNLPL